MFDEILDLYDDYSSNNLFADNRFVNQIFNIVNKYHKLGDYLTSVYISNKDSEYRSIDKTINICLISVDKALKELKRFVSEEDYIYIYNLFVIEAIFHELEHVYQEELKFSNEDSIERVLMILSDPIIMIDGLISNPNLINRMKVKRRLKKHNRFYNHNHNKAPHERLANLRAYNNMVSLLTNYQTDKKGIEIFYTIINDLIDRQLIYGYKLVGDITNSPSLDFLSKMKHTPNIYVIDNYDKFHDMDIKIEDRLLYGLHLYKDEYNDILKRIEEDRNEYSR